MALKTTGQSERKLKSKKIDVTILGDADLQYRCTANPDGKETATNTCHTLSDIELTPNTRRNIRLKEEEEEDIDDKERKYCPGVALANPSSREETRGVYRERFSFFLTIFSQYLLPAMKSLAWALMLNRSKVNRARRNRRESNRLNVKRKKSMPPQRRTHSTVKNSKTHEEGEIKINTTEMERIVQALVQTLQNMQEEFESSLREQQGQGMTLANPMAHQVDPWLEQVYRLGLPRFEGSSDPLACRNWLKRFKHTFTTLVVPAEDWVRLAVYFLDGEAHDWWERVAEREFVNKPLTTIKWSEFTAAFNKEYFPPEVSSELEMEFWNLRQGTMSVEEYANEFHRLEVFASSFRSEERRANKFVMGLRDDLRRILILGDFKNLSSVIFKAILFQRDIQAQRGILNSHVIVTPTDLRLPYLSGASSSGKRRKIQQFGHCQSGDNSTSSASSFKELVNVKTCFTCGRPGHIASQCYSRP